MGARLRVNEIYKSIQGESSWAGLPCVFIRLTGCHLRCTYCDTQYAFYQGGWMTLEEIVCRVAELGVHPEPQGAAGFSLRKASNNRILGCTVDAHLVEITGGEPLLQPACGPLAQKLLGRGYTVLCETSGALPIDRLPAGVIKIVDLKCPSSGEAGRNDWSNIDKLRPRDEVKFVIGNRGDFEWSVDVISRYGLARRCQLLMSPVFGEIEPRRLAEWILTEEVPVRFQLQMHKFIWEPAAIGV